MYGKTTRDWIALFKRLFSDPAVLGVYLGADYSKQPAPSPPALANTAYLGTYTNNFFGEIQIIERDNGLAIVEGPRKTVFPLTHYDRDTFTYKTEGENAVGTTGVTFTIGSNGKANHVVVENLNVRGEGVFKPVRNDNSQ